MRAQEPLLTLSGLAAGVAVSCAAWAAVAVSYLISTLHIGHLVDQMTGGHLVSDAYLASAFHRNHIVYVTLDAMNLAVVLAVMAWTAAALHNSAILRPVSRTSGSAALAWLVPVANLIAGPRLLGRARSAQRLALPPRLRPRGNYEIILVWWLLQLTVVGLEIFDWVERRLPLLADVRTTRMRLRLSVLTSALSIAAAAALLAAVAMITLTNERLRRTPALVEAERPGPPAPSIPLRPPTVSGYPSSIFPVAVHPSDPRWTPTSDPGTKPGSAPGYWA